MKAILLVALIAVALSKTMFFEQSSIISEVN